MDYQKLPIRTFIPKHVGDARQNWYKNRKKPELTRLGAQAEAPEYLAIANVYDFINTMRKLTAMHENLAVYFGTATEKTPDVVLLFAGIKHWCNLPEAYYLLNAKGALMSIPLEKAHALRNNYQNGMATLLHKSTDDGYTETEYVVFDKEAINEILDEFQYQADKGRISGLKVQLVSYADKSTEGGFLTSGKVPEYLQRLSVMFTYVKDGKDTSFEEIDPERHERTVKKQEGMLGSGSNSGWTVPPPRPPVPPASTII